MNIGDRIKFSFGETEKEGVVTKIFPKKVYLKVDFPNHPGENRHPISGRPGGKKHERQEEQEERKGGKREKSETGKEGKGPGGAGKERRRRKRTGGNQKVTNE